MRVNHFNSNAASNLNEGQAISLRFTGPLILHSDPVQPLHAATKRYTDLKFGSGLNAGNINVGIIPVTSLPVFGGDFVNAVGSGIFSLVPTGVADGTYTRVRVDAKGRVVEGAQITVSDIPDLSWNKVTQGRPTTLTGYGITDAIRSTGDALVGTIKVTGYPIQPLHAATKEYVDEKAVGLDSSEVVGSIITSTSPTPPEKFMRANGAVLLRAEYPSLYAALGERYSRNLQIGFGRPWAYTSEFIPEYTPLLGAWTNRNNDLPRALTNPSVFVTSTRLYVVGGDAGSTSLRTDVYYAPINADGSLGAWVTDTSFPVGLFRAASFVHNNFAYVVGGSTGSTVSTNTSSVYRSAISPQGELGPWVLQQNVFQVGIRDMSCFVSNNRLVCIGGATANGILNKVQHAPILPDGSIGTMVEAADLPLNIHATDIAVYGRYVYLMGGAISSGSATDSIYRSYLDQDGIPGTWELLPVTLSASRLNHRCVTIGNRIYVMGGGGISTLVGKLVHYYIVNPDGTLRGHYEDTQLPNNRRHGGVAFVGNHLYYIMGVQADNNYTVTVLSADVTGTPIDYSPYYNGQTYQTVDNNSFYLPDFTKRQTNALYYYIKYTD